MHPLEIMARSRFDHRTKLKPGAEWSALPESRQTELIAKLSEEDRVIAYAIWNAAIEEAAKVCNQGVKFDPPLNQQSETVAHEVAYLLTKAIRSLLSDQENEEGK